jgi:predicted component of viral defense system (DUF524 family)
MKRYIQLQGERVIGWGSTRGSETDVEINVADDHEVVRNPFVFTYRNGVLAKDEAYQQQLIDEKEERMNRQTTEQKYELMQKAVDDLILGGM